MPRTSVLKLKNRKQKKKTDDGETTEKEKKKILAEQLKLHHTVQSSN